MKNRELEAERARAKSVLRFGSGRIADSEE
jgi:hypothetical protein